MRPVMYDVLKKKKNDKPTCSQIKRKLFEENDSSSEEGVDLEPHTASYDFFDISVLHLYFPS